MRREDYQRFKPLLLGLPGWNRADARRSLLNELYWGHPIRDGLQDQLPPDAAADALIDALSGHQAADVDGLTPACAVLRYISIGFYRSLAAGRPIVEAFRLGRTTIRLRGSPGHEVPVLLTGPGNRTTCPD
jgi:hypothetical protein